MAITNMSSTISARLNILKLFLAFVLFTAMAWALNVKVRDLGVSWVEPAIERQEKWNPALYKALSFGQWPLAVDWLWIQALQDPALSHVPSNIHAQIYYNFDLATDLDPAFLEAYLYGGNLLSVVRNDNAGARDLLTKGEKFRTKELPQYPEAFRESFWKQAWWIPLTLGYVYMYEFYDMPGSAAAFAAASDHPGAPEYLKSLGGKLKTPEGQYETAIRMAEFFAGQAKDERIKKGYEKKRLDLILSQYLYNLNKQFMDFLKGNPEYRRSLSVTPKKIEAYWIKFRTSKRVGQADPFGGRLYLGEGGKIMTTTPREKVFGLD